MADVQYWPQPPVWGSSGSVTFGPVEPGNRGAGDGGVADPWNPHGAANMYSGFVVSGGHVNQDPVSGSGATAGGLDAHYYSGYWAGVESALYGLGIPAFGGAGPPMLHRPWDGPPSTYPFLRPAPDTRQASSGIGGILAAIGAAVVGPAEAGTFGSGGLDPSRVPYLFQPEGTGAGGGFRPTGLFETNKAQIEEGRAYADAPETPNEMKNWELRLLTEMANNSEFFPGGETSQAVRVGLDFARVNVFSSLLTGRDLLYTNSGLPLFPVYRQVFGPGTPPFLVGRQGVALDPGLGTEIFKWGEIIPYP